MTRLVKGALALIAGALALLATIALIFAPADPVRDY